MVQDIDTSDTGPMARSTSPTCKGHALARRLRDLKAQGRRITESRLAELLGKSRASVATWKAGRAWPSQAEEAALEELLMLPRGFFARIATGIDYELALMPTNGKDADNSATLQQLANLLKLPPAKRPDGAYTIEEIQAHLKKQLTLLFHLVMPTGVVTEDGMRQAYDLLRVLFVQQMARKL